MSSVNIYCSNFRIDFPIAFQFYQYDQSCLVTILKKSQKVFYDTRDIFIKNIPW